MIYLFFVALFILIIGGYTTLLYLIYLPLKNKLKRNGKLSDKKSRLIDYAFISLPFIVAVFAYNLKDYRTPSNERLQTISNIRLPMKYTILKDEYQDMLQDYCIEYELQFDKNNSIQLAKSIKQSKYFTNDFSKDTVWVKTNYGYEFNTPMGRDNYSIIFDTIKQKLEYQECHD